MQLDRSAQSVSSLKRPSDHSEFATAVKYARTGPSGLKRPTPTPFVSPSFNLAEMPQSRNNRGGGKPSTSKPSTSTSRPSTLSSTKKKPKNTPHRPPATLVNDPIRDQAYILKENADAIPSIKPQHVKDPISLANSVSMNITLQPLAYTTTRIQTRTVSNMIRYVFNCLPLTFSKRLEDAKLFVQWTLLSQALETLQANQVLAKSHVWLCCAS